MKTVVYIACSLDGFIADSMGKLDWLLSIPNETNSDYGFADFMKGIDAIVMGRKTFETVCEFPEWPYEKPVYILSNRLRKLPEHLEKRQCAIISGALKEILERLRQQGLNNLYIDGGKTIQSFLNEGLIDEMIISRTSHLLGSGIPLFADIQNVTTFKIYKVEMLNKYICKTYYRR